MVELKAILTGLLIAWDSGFRALIFEGDSTNATTMINNLVVCNPTVGRVITRITLLLHQNWEVTLQHSYKEGNRLVDSATNWVLNMNFTLYIWDNPSLILMFDVMGASTPALLLLVVSSFGPFPSPLPKVYPKKLWHSS